LPINGYIQALTEVLPAEVLPCMVGPWWDK